jgi:hypothetical protein
MGTTKDLKSQVEALVADPTTDVKSRRPGRKVLAVLAVLGIGAAVFSKVRGNHAGPPPFPAAPPVPRPAPPAAAPPPAAPEPTLAPAEEPESNPVTRATDVVSDPETDPLSEGSPVFGEDDAKTFFDQVVAETAVEPDAGPPNPSDGATT